MFNILKRLLYTTVVFAPGIAESQAGPSAYTYETRYDAAGRVVGTIAPDPDGSGPLRYAAVRNTYDSAGRLTKIEKGELSDWQAASQAPSGWTGFSVQMQIDTVYDEINRKSLERTSSGGIIYTLTQFSYDTAGHLACTAQRMNAATYGSTPASACDLSSEGGQGADRITRNIYNAAGQLVQVRKAVGTALEQADVTYSYTSNGKEDYIIDANGNRARKVYDGYDRLKQWQLPAQSPVPGFNGASQSSALTTAGGVNTADYEEYAYDANGNRTSFRKRDGKVLTYQYDKINRMIQKTAPASASGATGYVTFYGYDLRGLQTYARFDSVNGRGINSTYDGFGALVSSGNTMGSVNRVLTSLYDPNGNRTRLTYPDGTVVNSIYDGLDRMIALQDSAGTDLTVMTYYANGGRSGRGSGTDGTGYSYDGIQRLDSYKFQRSQFGTIVEDVTRLSYNPASQITQQSRSNGTYAWPDAVNIDRTYKVNGLNQYATVSSFAYSYDANGNLASDGSTTFVYDVENRLVATTGGRTTNLSYDPLGRLWQTDNGSAGTRFVYDGEALVAEYDTGNSLINRYVHANGVDEPVLWYQGATSVPYQLFADHHGSIISIKQQGQSLNQINTYDEYGIPGYDNIGRFQYTGQIWIPELRMYHYKARLYSPMLGRFLQTDPIGYGDQINLYAYVGNDPVNGRDPSGLYTCQDCTPNQQRVADAFVRGVQAAARMKGASESLQGTAASLGKKGEEGVNVGYATLERGTLGEQSGNQLSLDLSQIRSAASEIASQTGISGNRAIFAVGSSVLAHETKHYQDSASSYGFEKSVGLEKRAYQTGDEIMRLFGVSGLGQYGGQSANDYNSSVLKRARGSCIASAVSVGLTPNLATAKCNNQ